MESQKNNSSVVESNVLLTQHTVGNFRHNISSKPTDYYSHRTNYYKQQTK